MWVWVLVFEWKSCLHPYSHQTENVFGETSSDLGWVFFLFLDTFYQSSLAGIAKFLGSKKSSDFAKCSVVWFSNLQYLEFFEKEPSSQLGLSTHSKNFSANEWICWFAGRKHLTYTCNENDRFLFVKINPLTVSVVFSNLCDHVWLTGMYTRFLIATSPVLIALLPSLLASVDDTHWR